MRTLFISIMLILGAFANANSAVRVGAPAGRGASAASTESVGAVTARSAVRSVEQAQTSATPAKAVAARVATQKVINSGTKINAAVKNTVVDEVCQEKYFGCMDAFCMVENTNGGRCMCSNRNAELDDILADIEKLDQQSYQMATYGVERIEMGTEAEQVLAKADAAAKDAMDIDLDTGKRNRAKSVDLSLWEMSFADTDYEDDDIFASLESDLVGKKGDALQSAAHDLCVTQVPECSSSMSMLRLLYAQKIKSDCSAYENSLKQQKTASQTKLNTAERALRDAALEQLRAANKYDLGQCTVEFKKCMQKTGGCGDDFAACATVAASDNTNVNKSTKDKTDKYAIKGSVTTIEIYASTYDTLLAKKPLCETVTKQCQSVAEQVWPTFLKEVAPQIKSAELIAEDNARQNCIGNISSCFQKACKDNMDPANPESYDMCLTRPETMLNVCKIPLNACGIDASSASKAKKSQIWDFVVARLASMRVDSCTKEVKECLTSDDRCGSDYTQCVGLDTDTIMRMCPYDKLVGCQKVYDGQDIRGNKVYEEIAAMVQGIMLNIDNNMMKLCQQAADEAMIKICGDNENCNGLTVDGGVGSRSLDYKICEFTSNSGNMNIDYKSCRTDISQITDSELGRYQIEVVGQSYTNSEEEQSAMGNIRITGSPDAKSFAAVLDGVIYWENVEINDEGKLTTAEDYIKKLESATGLKNISEEQRAKIKSELELLQQNVNNAISAIESDPTVQYCMYGREVQGMNASVKAANSVPRFGRRYSGSGANDIGRFPELTKGMRAQIAMAALKKAKEAYYAKYDELNEKMAQDAVTLSERIAEIHGENTKDMRRNAARYACVNMSALQAIPKSVDPPKSAGGVILGAIGVAAVAGVLIASGAGAIALGTAGIVGASVAGAGSLGLGIASRIGPGANGEDVGGALPLTGSKGVNQWNYKETVTTTFEWETLVCHTCTRTQTCGETKNPFIGNKYCKTWDEPTESCKDTQF